MLAAILIAATMTVALSASRARADSNLVVNPGFETGSLSPWTCDAGTGSVVSSPVHSGSHALAGAANNSDNAQCTQTISVQPNSAYTLSAYVQGAYVYIGATGYSSTWTPSATSYQQLCTSFTTGASTTSVQIYLHGWYAQGTYYADDVSLVGPGGQTQVPPVPTGLSVTGTTSSSVSLSWSRLQRCHRVQRLPRRHEGRERDRHLVHRLRPERLHQLQLHGHRDELCRGVGAFRGCHGYHRRRRDHDPADPERPVGDRDDVELGVVVVERFQRRDRLQRVPRRFEGRERDRDLLHRLRPERVDHLQLRGLGDRLRRRVREVLGGQRHHRPAPAAPAARCPSTC